MQLDVIDPKKTAIIVVDMQNDFVAPGAAMETPSARQIVPKLAEALRICREAGIRVVYTAHVHRRDGCDMGLFDDLHPAIANRDALVDGTTCVDIYSELAPRPGEHVIKKHRYSGFFGTDLDIILREWGCRYRRHLRDDNRELLPRQGAGRHVSQLPSRIFVGRDSHL